MDYKETIDIKAILLILWRDKGLIIAITFLASIISVIAALATTDIYKSEAILAPASDSGELSKLANQYSGLVGMAGINIPGGSDTQTKVINGIEIIKSFDFFENLSTKNDLIFLLLAPNGWNKESNTLKINKKVYDVEKKQWNSKNQYSKNQYSINGKPTTQTAYRYFHQKKFTISRDLKTGLVSLSFEHYSPVVAKEVLNLLIKEINDISRNDAIKRASNSIEYLEEEIRKTDLIDLKSGLNDLIESQIELIMIANASPEHLFKVLSPPIASEKKFKPKRSLICIFGFFMGAILGSIIAIMRHYMIPKELS